MQDLARLASALHNQSTTPLELCRDYIRRAKSVNDQLNALVWLDEESILREATEKTEALAAAKKNGASLPKYFGVPLPMKLLTEVAGWPSTMGSVATKDRRGKYDAAITARLRQAGFILAGLTNSPEFGTIPVTENTLYGPTLNPWNTKHTPGGSSGGASALVAARVSAFAHASDGGGSIRIPASCTGIYGLKPSRGRVPKGPFISESLHGSSVDGFVSLSVADSAALLDCVSDPDYAAWYTAPKFGMPYGSQPQSPSRRLRIGVSLKTPISSGTVHHDCAAAVEDAAALLSNMGHEVFAYDQWYGQAGDTLADDFLTLWSTISAYVDVIDWEKCEPHNRHLREMAKARSSHDYVKAYMRLQMFSRAVVTPFGSKVDMLLTPTLSSPPLLAGEFLRKAHADPKAAMMQGFEFAGFTGWFNITGQPAASLPLYWNAAGLPIGVQLVGAPFREDELLQLSRDLEQQRPWVGRVPQVNALSHGG